MKRIMSIILVIAMAFTLGLTTTAADDAQIIEFFNASAKEVAGAGTPIGTSATESGKKMYGSNNSWFEFDVNVETAGAYEITVRAAGNAGEGQTGQVLKAITEVNSASATFAATGGWDSFSELVLGSVYLKAGDNKLRVQMTSGYNIYYDYVKIAYDETTVFDFDNQTIEFFKHSNASLADGSVLASGGTASGKRMVMFPGNWMEFEVYAEKAGAYDVTVRAAGQIHEGQTGQVFTASANGISAAAAHTAVGAWDDFSETALGNVYLSEGMNTLRVSILGTAYVDYVKLAYNEDVTYDFDNQTIEFFKASAKEVAGDGNPVGSGATESGKKTYASNGSWFEFDVLAENAGAYNVSIRAAGQLYEGCTGQTITATANNTSASAVYEAPGAWEDFAIVELGNVTLNKGMNKVKVTLSGANFYYDYVALSYDEDGEVTPDEPEPDTSITLEAELGITEGNAGPEGNANCSGGLTQTMYADSVVVLNADVETAGNYLIQASACSGATLTTTIGEKNAKTSISSGWGEYILYDIGVAELVAGENEIRISTNSLCSIDYIKLIPTTDDVTFTEDEPVIPDEPETDALKIEFFNATEHYVYGGSGQANSSGATESGKKMYGNLNSWFDFDVSVEKAGAYAITVRAAGNVGEGQTGQVIQATTEVSSVSAIFTATGGWEAFTELTLGSVYLKEGDNKLRITMVSGYNIYYDYVKIAYDKNTEFDFDSQTIEFFKASAKEVAGDGNPVGSGATESGKKTYASNGSWFEFDIYAEKAGAYDVTVRAAGNAGEGQTGQSITASANGTAANAVYTAPGGWETFTELALGTVYLKAGNNKLRVTMYGCNFYYDYVNIAYNEDVVYDFDNQTVEFFKYSNASLSDSTVMASGATASGKRMVAFPGNWFEFTVYIENPGTYNIDVRGAGNAGEGYTGQLITATANSQSVQATHSATGDWESFSVTEIGDVVLSSGVHTIKIAIDGTMYLDYVNLELTEGTGGFNIVGNVNYNGIDGTVTYGATNIASGEASFTLYLAHKKGEKLLDIIKKDVTVDGNDSVSFTDVKAVAEGETFEVYCWDMSFAPVAQKKNKVISSLPVEIYVSVSGSDSADGLTESGAVKTLAAAQTIARTYAAENDVIVNIGEGTYYISEPITFTSADTPNGEYHVAYRGSKNGETVISGGAVLSGVWQQHDGNIWKIEVPQADIRQFYVNGTKAVMARTDSIYKGIMFVDDPEDATTSQDGVYVMGDSVLTSLAGAQSAEAVCDAKWTRDIFPIKSINDIGVAEITMKQPALANAMEVSAGLENTLTSYGFYIQNDVALIDEPGEFAFDRVNGVLYYYPRTTETLADAICVAGASEGLVTVDGTTDALVTNLIIENITFENGTWLSPSENGLVVRQGDSISVDGTANDSTNVMLPPQIKVNYADNFIFRNNTIKNVGSGGIGIIEGVKNSKITDNTITDTAAGAIIVGSFAHANNEGKMVSDCVIDNNYIRNTGLEYASSPAIAAYYIKKTKITHNDIANTSLAGISLGWGWNPNWSAATGNTIAYNKVTDVVTSPLNDSAPMYIIGNQGDSVIEYNYFGESHEYEGTGKTVAEHGGVYFDNGTSSVHLRNNVIEGAANWFFGFWQEDSFYNKIGTNYTNINSYYAENLNDTNEFTQATVESSWSAEAQEIINNAGLRK